MRTVNRSMPWIACCSAAVLVVALIIDGVGPAEPVPGGRAGPLAAPAVDEPDPMPPAGSGLAPPVSLDPVEAPASLAPSAPAKPRSSPGLRRPAAHPAPRAVPAPLAIAPAADTTAPELVVITPSGPEFSLRPRLRIRVRSEPGARVVANGLALREGATGEFTGTLRLSPGANELEVTAEDEAGNRTARAVRVTYVDLDRLPQDRRRLERMVTQLEEIRTAAAELDRRILDLLGQMQEVAGATQITRLSEELHRIRQARREVGQELSQSLGQLDSLLAVAP